MVVIVVAFADAEVVDVVVLLEGFVRRCWIHDPFRNPATDHHRLYGSSEGLREVVTNDSFEVCMTDLCKHGPPCNR